MLTNFRIRSCPSLARSACSLLAAAAGATGLAGCPGGDHGEALAPVDFRAAVLAAETDVPGGAQAPPSGTAAAPAHPAARSPAETGVITLTPIELDDDPLRISTAAPGEPAGAHPPRPPMQA